MLELNLPKRFNAAQYLVDRNVEEGRGERPAIFFEDQTYNYHQVLEKVNRSANMLDDLGVERENRVMLLVRDSPEMIFSFFGAIKLGAVSIPTNMLMKSQDFLYVLNDSRARVLIVDPVFLPEIEKILDQAAFCKKIVVLGGEDHGYLSFDRLMENSSDEFEAADTTSDDAAFWLYSGRNPEVLTPDRTLRNATTRSSYSTLSPIKRKVTRALNTYP
jgi:acyl-coenzyme A synthetase/AMP-(fatty) acid ligase